LIDTDTLKLIQKHAMLVNTSRGGLINTHSVIAALKEGRLGGLAIDVYEEEGDYFFEDLSGEVIGDDDLMRLTTFPNVLVTGHQAFLTHEALNNIAQTTLLNANDASLQENNSHRIA
jgi:D-lactate dehydrogenase